MTQLGKDGNVAGGWNYSATVSSSRPSTDYTVRMTAHHNGLEAPVEADQIRWQK